tara:strand:+ start:414 stop:854 length:441 start_codon:yes stop_codon:yes gene_type:complete
MIKHIISYLKTQSGVTAIVGTRPVSIFPHDVPKKMNTVSGLPKDVTVPYIIIEKRGGEAVRGMEGRTGVREMNFLVEAVSDSIRVAEALYEALIASLDSKAHVKWDGIEVQYSELSEGADTSIPATDGAQDSLKVFAGSLFVRVNI